MIGLDLVFFTVFAANPMLSFRCLISVVRFSEEILLKEPRKIHQTSGLPFPFNYVFFMSLRFDLEMVISLSMDSQDSQKEFTWGSMSFGQISIYINKGSHKIGLMVLSSFVLWKRLSKVWFRDIYHHSSELFFALLNATSLSHGNCQFMMPHRRKKSRRPMTRSRDQSMTGEAMQRFGAW